MLTLFGLALYRLANGGWREAEENIGALVAVLLLDVLATSFVIWWLS